MTTCPPGFDPHEYSRAAAVVNRSMRSIVPPTVMSTADWLREHFRDEIGRHFNEVEVPWVTAPGGPCEAIDDPRVNVLWLQWAARMFKTTFCQSVQMKYAAEDPCNMMFATVDHTNCKSVFRRFWKMLEHCNATRDQVPHERLQSAELVKLRRCTIYGAWVRGASTLADKAIRIGHGNEIDKWVHLSTSTEGDPLGRFLKRGNQFADSKFLMESTPSVKNRSRVEQGRLRSSNCHYHVPCPHCGKFDVITFGDGTEPPGIFWESRDGRSDPDLARETAYYVCGHCKNDIHDIHRAVMMTSGIWLPEGCKIDHDKAHRARELPLDDKSYLRGEPTRNNNEWGGQISVFYALFHGWGDIARDFIKATKSKPQLRQWTNEDKAETWEIVESKQTWETLASVMIVTDKSLKSEVVPDWAKFLTIAIDCQGSFFRYGLEAWGPDERNHVLRYGDEETTAGLFERIIDRRYRTATTSKMLKISLGLIDVGFQPNVGHEFSKLCRSKGYMIWPCKGSKTALDYDYSIVTLGEKTSAPGERLVHVDTTRTQYHLESVLANPRGQSTIYYGSKYEHQDYIEQLLNDAAIESLDSSNNLSVKWQRIDENCPNDDRDIKRYNYIARLMMTKSRPITESFVLPSEAPAPRPTAKTETKGGFVRGGKIRKLRGGIRRG